ncbi:MAG: glycosyltransferase family 4 protein [Crocinitomicaceae bacterium]|nr:glycosyltransferase family 4 protein [Crocinitomicaceae bacterium]
MGFAKLRYFYLVKSKVGYICGTDSWGGLEMNQLRNAIWMHERGHSVYVICLKGSPIAKNAEEAGIPTIFIQKHRKYFDFKRGKELATILQQHQITHLLVRAIHDMSIAVIAKRKVKSLHLSYFMEMQLGVKKTNFLHTLRFSYFDLWACPLHWLSDQVKTMTRFNHAKLKVIPSGLDLRQFEKELEKKDARQQLELPSDCILFGLIGRFDRHKGQLLLLEALQKCQNKEIGIVLLGEPTRNEGSGYADQMNTFIEEHQLSNRVFVRPFRKDIDVFYKAVDWFVMASKAETFGMVTIEAMACGTPTLGSNAGGTPEILHFGELGVLFESLNATDLAAKMDEITLGKHAIDRKKLIQAAQLFDHNKVCEQVENALGI